MKLLCIGCLLTLCSVPPAFCAEETLEEFYVRMELEYAAEEHPEVKGLAAALNVLREEALNDMQAMLEARRVEVEATRAGMLNSGLGSRHPDVVQLEEQLKAIEKRLREACQVLLHNDPGKKPN